MQQETILQELSELRQDVIGLRKSVARAQRRGRARAILGTLALAASLVVVSAPQAAAQLGITLSSLSARVDALTAALNTEKADRASGDATLQSRLAAEAIDRATADASLASRATGLETKTQYMLVDGSKTIFRGTNVMVQSGSGSTEGTVNGLGNLIVGYNEVTGPFGDERGGSHNLVVGTYHDYLSYGGVLFGKGNGSRATYASVTGGDFNIASGQYSSVTGGSGNTASGFLSSMSGGYTNIASGFMSSVSGGYSNTESRDFGWRASSTLTN